MKRLGVQFANGMHAVTPLPTDEDAETAAQLRWLGARRGLRAGCTLWTPHWTPCGRHVVGHTCWMHALGTCIACTCWMNTLDACAGLHVGCTCGVHVLHTCIGHTMDAHSRAGTPGHSCMRCDWSTALQRCLAGRRTRHSTATLPRRAPGSCCCSNHIPASHLGSCSR